MSRHGNPLELGFDPDPPELEHKRESMKAAIRVPEPRELFGECPLCQEDITTDVGGAVYLASCSGCYDGAEDAPAVARIMGHGKTKLDARRSCYEQLRAHAYCVHCHADDRDECAEYQRETKTQGRRAGEHAYESAADYEAAARRSRKARGGRQ